MRSCSVCDTPWPFRMLLPSTFGCAIWQNSCVCKCNSALRPVHIAATKQNWINSERVENRELPLFISVQDTLVGYFTRTEFLIEKLSAIPNPNSNPNSTNAINAKRKLIRVKQPARSQFTSVQFSRADVHSISYLVVDNTITVVAYLFIWATV